jgi:serine/threonine protein kinase
MENDKSSNREDFEREVEILSSLRCLNHPNIIRLITAYTIGDSYNFLFPVANCDLSALLLSSNTGPWFSTSDDIIASLWGLSSAIEKVHNFFASEYNVRKIGCHYDIKPQNILCMNDKLVLSDFGLSRLRSDEESSRSLFQRGEGSYIAPECEPSEKDFKPAPIGRASDIWSFGCVLSEVLAYVSAPPGDGPDAVNKFRAARKGCLGECLAHHFHSVDGVRPAVISFLSKYAADPASASVFKSLAILIEEILQFRPEERPNASIITRRLFHLSQRNVLNKISSMLKSRLASFDLDLQIEFQRLGIWGKTVGLASEGREMEPSAWLQNPHSRRQYEDVQDILRRCLVEAQNIVIQIDKNRKPPYKLSYHLQGLLDGLWDMQPEDAKRNMTRSLEELILNSQDIKGLMGLHENIDLSSREVAGRSNERLDSYRRVAYLATMKEVALAVTQQPSSNHDFSMDRSSLGPPTTTVHNHILKTMSDSGERVLVEFMEYQDAWVARVPELIERVNAISALLSRGVQDERIFPVLKCKGYYHDIPHPRFGIVYQLPSMAKNTDPVNLVQIIHDTSSRTAQASLTKKFELASSLVSHVLDFHLGGWLHKSICSFNVIFFPRAFKTPVESLSSPYFIGFNRSRLNDESAFTVPSTTELEYQHPEYLKHTKESSSAPGNQSPRFRQEFDYYSVGLVLMEIAFWKPLAGITKRIKGSPEELVVELLKTHIPLVKTYMGDAYGNAIESCLTCYKSVDENAEVVRENFRRNVVVPISNHSV